MLFLLVLLTEPRKFFGTFLFGSFLTLQLFLPVLVTVSTGRFVFGPGMATDIAVLAYLAYFLGQVLRLFEQVVTEFLGIGDGLFLVLLVFLLDDGRRIYLAVGLSLRKIQEGLLEPPHRTIDIIGIGSLQLIHLVIGFHCLVDQCLCLGLQEEHLDIVSRFLREDIVPLGNGVVVTESLAVLAVQFFGLLLFLLLTAGELLQLANGVVYLETGLYHLALPSLSTSMSSCAFCRASSCASLYLLNRTIRPVMTADKPSVRVAMSADAAAVEMPRLPPIWYWPPSAGSLSSPPSPDGTQSLCSGC